MEGVHPLDTAQRINQALMVNSIKVSIKEARNKVDEQIKNKNLINVLDVKG
jgi:hypothetical protein